MPDYMPSKDADFRTWAENFSSNINLSPATFMMSAAEAAGVAAAVTIFVAKLSISENELTRTKQSIADKDDARSICENLCRQYAMLIKENDGITDGDKLIIGVRPENPNREPIEVPTTPPLLNIIGQLPGQMTLRYSDSTTPDSAKKPFGATSMQLFLGIGPEEPMPIEDCAFHGNFTRNPIEVEFNENDDKKTASFYARWCSARGQVGPWSLPMTMTIAA